jgi:hypothetical protein
MLIKFTAGLVLLLAVVVAQESAAQINHVSADATNLTLEGRASQKHFFIAELAPYQSSNELQSLPIVAQVGPGNPFAIPLPRWDGPRDRLYSGFLAFVATNGTRTPLGNIRFVEKMDGVSIYAEAFPETSSKKGLQVQMVDDAIALGVKHAALNVNLAAMIDLSGGTNHFTWQSDGVTYHFRRSVIEILDAQVGPLSHAGMVVTLILLCYEDADPAINRIMLHPDYSPSAPNHLSAFNTVTPEGCRYFKSCIEFLADRYSRPPYQQGRAVNFIVGNEVNAHWQWCNLGEASMEKFAEDYLRTVRICRTAVRKFSSCGRVYICLEHHWNIQGDASLKSFRGRAFVDYFGQLARAGGDFDWNLAYHPYPEDLTEPRTWNDQTATRSEDTPRITFKNLEMLPLYFSKPELLYQGRQRHIILSEQGFNMKEVPDGELWQAAAYCYAYYKTARLPGIDSFILNRHVDHRNELPLRLGLWRRDESAESPCQPTTRKMIYEIFRLADTPQWREAFAFALPVTGIRQWEDLDLSAPGGAGVKK